MVGRYSKSQWTRVEVIKKSVLNYMIIETENEELVKEMWINSGDGRTEELSGNI